MNRILLIYPNQYLAYSPTTLRLYDQLTASFDVQIVTFVPDPKHAQPKLKDKKVMYIQPSTSTKIALLFRGWIMWFIKRNGDPNLYSGRAMDLIQVIKRFKGTIIAVDFFALWCAQVANRQSHLVSLEIHDKDKYRKHCDLSLVRSVIIQSKERYIYLFGQKKIRTFFIQNSPAYSKTPIEALKRDKKHLVYCGNSVPSFGIFNCLEFLSDFPDYVLTVKGAIPTHVKSVLMADFGKMLEKGQLVLNEEYMNSGQLIDYLSGFRIGFVFYDYFRFRHINTFNYHSAPSGKLFDFYNAGVPVIVNNIFGLNSVQQHRTGVMIETMGSIAIKRAIDTIEGDYEGYADRSKKTSLLFDSSKGFEEYENYLVGEPG